MAWEKRKRKDNELPDEPLRHTNKRKKTGRWCKGKVGVEHQPELVVNHNMQHLKPCAWRVLYRWRGGAREIWRWHYSCKHSYRCINCGKYTEYFLKPEQCPDFKPQPDNVAT